MMRIRIGGMSIIPMSIIPMSKETMFVADIFGSDLFTPRNVLALAALLFCIGVYGVLARRNLLIMLMSLEMMLVAVNVVLVLFSRMAGDDPGVALSEHAFRLAHSGQFFTVMVMTVAAGEVGVGLAIVIMLYRARGNIDVGGTPDMRY